jgi:replicative DNA helicase
MALTEYNFSTDFQDELLVCMVRHPEMFIGLESVIKFSYFTGTNSQLVCKLMQDFQEKHKTYPNLAQLATLAIQMTRQTGEAEKAEEIKVYLQGLAKVKLRAKEFYRDQAVDFAKHRAVLLACVNVAKQMQEGKEPGAEVVKWFQDALAVGQNLGDQGILVKADYNEVIDRLSNQTIGTYTGYEIFDSVLWRHGLRPGWLFVPVAPPKRWKTAFCLNMAVNMVGPKCGYDVLYYACEISEDDANLRVYQNILGRTSTEFYDDPEKFRTELHKGLQHKMHGDLLIKHFPAKTATINDIRAHAISVIESLGLKPKAIFIDYAETVKPSNTDEKSEYRQQSDIYTEARALGHELGCVIIMPDRCNRETVDQATPSMTAFQGAFEKAGIVDVALGLCATNEEYQKGDLRFFVFLNRHGEGGVHMRGKIDKARMQISIDEILKPYEEAAVEEQAQNERDAKYSKKHRPKGKSREIDSRLNDNEPSVIKGPSGRPIRV